MDYSAKEADDYVHQLERSGLKFSIISRKTDSDGATVIEVKKQYNTAPTGDYISDVIFFLLASIPEDVNPAGIPAFFILEGIVPKTKFQSIVFALLMVFFMVVAMEFYNQGLMEGRL